MDKREEFIDLMARFTAYTGIYLPDDVRTKLEELRAKENSPMAKIFYDAMFDDLAAAAELKRPCCQDTGVLQYFVRAGSRFPLIDAIEEGLREAVKRATVAAPLRPNVVEVFDEKNTGVNVGTRIPWIDWEIVPGSDEAVIYSYMAGGGCSLPGAAKVLMPLDGYEGVLKFIFDRIASYGINACPPLLVGVGIAGTMEAAAKLSKKALLRTIGSRNENARGADMEKMMEEELNSLKLGPGGIGGENSVMAVHIEQAGRHPSTLAVGLSTGCWAHRRGKIRVKANLEYTVLSHSGAAL
jgi:L(+)-tartrate dehydratase alpha subunit